MAPVWRCVIICASSTGESLMRTQLHLPVQPSGAREINAVVAIVERAEQVAYFASGVPLFVHRVDDVVGRRVAAGQMMASRWTRGSRRTAL